MPFEQIDLAAVVLARGRVLGVLETETRALHISDHLQKLPLPSFPPVLTCKQPIRHWEPRDAAGRASSEEC